MQGNATSGDYPLNNTIDQCIFREIGVYAKHSGAYAEFVAGAARDLCPATSGNLVAVRKKRSFSLTFLSFVPSLSWQLVVLCPGNWKKENGCRSFAGRLPAAGREQYLLCTRGAAVARPVGFTVTASNANFAKTGRGHNELR
jgi:hypothetical protein